MFEIIEALLHEPKHLKQLLEYEKDNNDGNAAWRDAGSMHGQKTNN